MPALACEIECPGEHGRAPPDPVGAAAVGSHGAVHLLDLLPRQPVEGHRPEEPAVGEPTRTHRVCTRSRREHRARRQLDRPDLYGVEVLIERSPDRLGRRAPGQQPPLLAGHLQPGQRLLGLLTSPGDGPTHPTASTGDLVRRQLHVDAPHARTLPGRSHRCPSAAANASPTSTAPDVTPRPAHRPQDFRARSVPPPAIPPLRHG